VTRNKAGALHSLELRDLRGDSSHVCPVFFRIAVDAGIEDLDGVLGNASSRTLPETKKDPPLAPLTKIAAELECHGVVDSPGAAYGIVSIPQDV
jgi:hypothetical protein